MNKHLPAALFTARQYAKRYAEGGEVEETRPPAPMPPGVSVSADDDTIAPPLPDISEGLHPSLMKNVEALSAMRHPGPPPPKPDLVPLKPSEQGLTEYHPSMYERAAQWFYGDKPASPAHEQFVKGVFGTTGLGERRMGLLDVTPVGQALSVQEELQHGHPTEAAMAIMPGFHGAKEATSVAGNVAKNVFRELAPEAVSTAKKIPLEPGHAPGSQDGAMHTGFADGRDRYIKRAKSEDHALNERLGAALYKELGVPSADVELTEVNGKPHISSPKVPGVQLGESGVHPHDLMDIQQGLPADQFLAGYDSIGLNQDNIIVAKDGTARRIDFGGTLRYRAQGKPKVWWGKDVKEFESFFDPNVNPQAAEAFVPHGVNPNIDAARKQMAGRIANLSDSKIADLVHQYGPREMEAKVKLAEELKSRRDQVAKFYGVGKAEPGPAPQGGSAIHPQPNESGKPVTIHDPHNSSTVGTWTDPKATATFVPGNLSYPELQLNHAQLKRYKPWDSWDNAPGTLDEAGIKEPAFEKHPSKNTASGVVIVEPDGRMWLRSPTNQYGGVKNGFPKGTKEPGLSLQANAIKEAFEETGLKVRLLKHLTDVEGTTSKTRYYLAQRESGHPGDMGWESQAVHLAPHADAAKMLHMPADQQVLKALQEHNALHELLPKAEQVGVKELSLNDPKADAKKIIYNKGNNPKNIAEAMYRLAAKSIEYPEYVDQIYKHLPQHMQVDVNDALTNLTKKHGDPWKDEFHDELRVEHAPDDWAEPLTDEEWEKHLNESVPPLQAHSQTLENAAIDWLVEKKGLIPEDPEDQRLINNAVESAMKMGWEPPLVPKKSPTTAANIQNAKDYLEFLGHDPKDPDDKYLFADPVKWAEAAGMEHNTLFASLQESEKMEVAHAALEAKIGPAKKVGSMAAEVEAFKKAQAAKGVSPADMMAEHGPVSMQEELGAFGKSIGLPPQNVPKPMQINKTHTPGQIVHALKDYGKAAALQQPAIITPKQIGKIEQIMASKQPEALATEMASFSHDQISNLYSWMPQKHMDSVGDSLSDLAAKGKAYHKGPDQYQKDLKEYYDNQDKHAQHEEALYTGEPTLPKPAPKAAPLPKKSYADQEWVKTLFQDIPDWSKYKIKASHQFVPLDIPKAHLAVLQQQHGFNPMKIFHSSGEFGPNKQVLYPNELWHPTKKVGTHAEQALFGSTHSHIAGGYHGKPVAFIARGSKTAEFDWGRISSYGGYSTPKMQAVIGAARAKGYDLVVVKNIHDIGDAGPQHQFLILEPHILRAPTANFDPTKLHKAWPLAGIAGGFMYTYGSMPGEKDQGRMAKGGKVMPLRAGSSKKVVSQNISEFHTGKTYAHTASKFGKERANKQAIAVALSTARKYGKGKALGGPNESMESMVTGQAMRSLRHEGMIHSSVPGRTDKLPMKVRSGSYILPADIPSALGQGNTMAGGDILKKMFSSGPYGLPTMKGGQSRMPRPMNIKQQMMPKKLPGTFAEGGAAEDDHVPIVAAGGEYIIHPDVVRDVGHGDIKTGHKVLDKFVLSVRKKNIDTLKNLPGPKK